MYSCDLMLNYSFIDSPTVLDEHITLIKITICVMKHVSFVRQEPTNDINAHH